MAATATSVPESCAAAKRASHVLAAAPTEQKNEALRRTAELLEERSDQILKANAADLADERAARLTSSLRDRLTLTPERIDAIIERLRTAPASHGAEPKTPAAVATATEPAKRPSPRPRAKKSQS